MIAVLTAVGAALAAGASLQHRRTVTAAAAGFQIPADQLPKKIRDGLRRPSSPECLVSWDPATKASQVQR